MALIKANDIDKDNDITNMIKTIKQMKFIKNKILEIFISKRLQLKILLFIKYNLYN